MSLQLVTSNNCRNTDNANGMPPMRSGGHTFATMRRQTVRRIQPAESAAANDVALLPTIEEVLSRWIDQNPPQLYRGGA